MYLFWTTDLLHNKIYHIKKSRYMRDFLVLLNQLKQGVINGTEGVTDLGSK